MFRRGSVAWAALVFAGGCGGRAELAQGAATCATPAGVYIAHLTQTSGDCGTVEDFEVTAGAPVAGCESRDTFSADGCTETEERTCTYYAGTPGESVNHEVEVLTWTPDASSAAGTLDHVTTGAITCESAYDVVYTRSEASHG